MTFRGGGLTLYPSLCMCPTELVIKCSKFCNFAYTFVKLLYTTQIPLKTDAHSVKIVITIFMVYFVSK